MIPEKRIYTAIDMNFLKIRFKCMESIKGGKSSKSNIQMVEYECLTRWQ